MSYVVSIRRTGSPIEAGEIETVFRDDSDFDLDDDDDDDDDDGGDGAGALVATWRASDAAPPETFVFFEGEVTVTTPSNAALAKMQHVAKVLGACVAGEEGEDLTDVPVDPRPPAGERKWGIVLVPAVVVALLWWWLA